MNLADHPTVKAYNENRIKMPQPRNIAESSVLKETALQAGADDVGLIDLDRESVSKYRQELADVMPDVKSIMMLVYRVNQNNLRSLPHSVADFEFKQAWSNISQVSRKIVKKLHEAGIKAVNMPAGFPQEQKRWPHKIWLTNDKEFAVEAGLGHMGDNRLVLHPEFGAAIILGTILLSVECDQYDRPLDFDPCIKCGLCIKVCPTGAVKGSGKFDLLACLTHNYRERMGGFQDWVEQIVESKDVADYRSRVSDAETYSMWQHLAIWAQTKCDRCMAVCPAGESAIGEFLEDRKAYTKRYLTRFRDLEEIVYVVKGSDAEKHVESNFPAKQAKVIGNGIHLD